MAESQISTNLLAHQSVPYKLKSWRDFFTRSLTETNTVFLHVYKSQPPAAVYMQTPKHVELTAPLSPVN